MGVQSSDVVIAVMGMTGAGKSTFIKSVTGREDIRVGHGLSSGQHLSTILLFNGIKLMLCPPQETEEVTSYKFTHGSVNFVLVDTPGFDDSRSNDNEIVRRVLTWLQKSYAAGVRLHGLIYVHRIIDPRMRGTALSNLRVFRRLCGPDCFKNVVLATNFWGEIDPAEGMERERELCGNDDFWGSFVKKESRVVRIGENIDSDRKLLLSIALNDKCTLAAQREMEERSSMLETGAVQEVNKRLAQEQKHYEAQLLAEKAEFRNQLLRRERDAKAAVEAQRLALEKEQEDISRRAQKDAEARQAAWESRQRAEIQRQAQDKVRRTAELKRLQEECDQEKRCLELRRQEDIQYYTNYKCKRRRKVLLEFRCDGCHEFFDTRRKHYYRKFLLQQPTSLIDSC